MVWVKSIAAFRLFAGSGCFLFALEVTEMDLLAVDADLGLPFFAGLVPRNAHDSARIVLVG